MTPTPAGNFRDRVLLQRPDAATGDLQTYTTYATPKAEIKPLQGRERDFAMSFAATVNHKITIRFCPGVKPSDRVFIDNGDPSTYRVFSIDGIIDPENYHRELQLFCTEILNYSFGTPAQ